MENKIKIKNIKNKDNMTKLKDDKELEFNEETINLFSRNLDTSKILIKHKEDINIPNDTNIICLLLKNKLITEYHCSIDKCKIGKIWNGKPIQLLLNRKNNITNDLTVSNLELICPNCYMSLNGCNIFKKVILQTIFKCKSCGYIMSKCENTRKCKTICFVCESTFNKLASEKQEDEYFKKLQSTYNNNPILSDTIKHSNNYSNISNNYSNKQSNYNNSKSNEKSNVNFEIEDENEENITTKSSKSSKNKKSIITFNMSVPDLQDFI